MKHLKETQINHIIHLLHKCKDPDLIDLVFKLLVQSV
jgi:hypothetical protein